mmetsp:Transcript_131040/g.226835  ORF Transcript_131040/g.226835 Transcript_131040/m.226835 type:complete len:182 (-) Transcript_131040:1370-1915(-)
MAFYVFVAKVSTCVGLAGAAGLPIYMAKTEAKKRNLPKEDLEVGYQTEDTPRSGMEAAEQRSARRKRRQQRHQLRGECGADPLTYFMDDMQNVIVGCKDSMGKASIIGFTAGTILGTAGSVPWLWMYRGVAGTAVLKSAGVNACLYSPPASPCSPATHCTLRNIESSRPLWPPSPARWGPA